MTKPNRIINKLEKLLLDLLIILIPLIVVVVSLIISSAPAETILVIGLFYGLLIIPGFLLFRLLNLPQNPFFTFLSSFVFGVVLLLYPALTIYVLQLKIEFLLYAQLTISFFLLILNILNVNASKIKIKINIYNIVLGALSLFYLLVAINKGSHEAGDSVFHITYIGHLINNVPINPYEAHFPVEAVNLPYGYNIWYLINALVGKLANTEAYIVWRSSIYFLCLLLPAGVYYFSKAILKKPKYAIWTLITFSFYYLYKGYLNDVATITYPDRIARLLMVAVAIFLFQRLIVQKEISNKNKYLFLAMVLIVSAMFSVHMFSWMFFFIFILIFFLIDYLVKKRPLMKSLKFYISTGLVIIFASLPAMILKLNLLINNSLNPLSPMGGKRDKYLIYFDNGMLSYKPSYLLSIGLITTSVALLTYFGIVNYKKKKRYWYYYSWLVILIPVIIMTVPPITTIGYRLFSIVYIGRLISFVPIFIIIGAIFGGFLHKKKMEILALVLLFILLFQVNTTVNHRPSEIKSISSGYEYIKDNIPPHSTIISNLWDSFYLGAYSDNYIVATYANHMTSNVDGEERINDVKNFLDPATSEMVRREVINRYNVDYLLIRKKAPTKNGYRIYWNPTMALYSAESAEIFDGNNKYEEVYENREFVLYKVSLK